MTPTIRPARREDAAAMVEMLNAIIARGGTTAHKRPFDEARMREHYLCGDGVISCMVAVENGTILGFQSLCRPDPDYPGEDALGPGWGLIASFVALGQQGRGIGHLLFAATREAARSAGIEQIDATIRRENTGGQAFYASLGFVPDRETAETVSKRFDLSGAQP